MDFRHLIVTCLFSMLRLSFETQKIKENYAILIFIRVAYYLGKMFFFSYFFVFTCIQAGGAVFSGYKKRMYQTRIFFCFDTSSLL